jgi:Asp-tRNA(Asn)/Glu-tRNA(Gln) amidotransferase A subunit family amidase
MTIGDTYESHDAIGLAECVRRGDVKPAELLEAAIERAERSNPKINAVVIPLFDEARRLVAAGPPDGPFHGVPFLLKDLYAAYAGVRLTHGSQLFSDFVPDHDSELVARYKRAGLVIFGRSASPEFGITTSTESVLFGATRNPWNLERMAGGSSGGAAAAGCGLFGLKPTRARTPSGPDAGEGWSGMSTAHVVSRSVRDSAALLDATQGPDLGAPYWAPPPRRPYLEEASTAPGRLRIGLQTRSFNGVETHADCVAAAEDAARLCAEQGHDVEPAALEIDTAAFARASQVIIASNLRATLVDRAAELGRELAPGDVEPMTFTMASAAGEVEAADYARAIRTIHALGRQVARFLERYDVLLTPTLASPPFEIGRLALTASDLPGFLEGLLQTVGYTQLFNATGNPAASVPLHWNAEGLPIGVQLAGRFGDEATLLRLAAQLEQARPWFDRRPALA